MKKITQMKQYYVDLARQEAEKSNMYQKHGCVIVKSRKVDNRKIVVKGYNYTKTEFNHKKSIHAEVDAFMKIAWLDDFSDCDVYVVRICNTNHDILRYSRPCKDCAQLLMEKKFRNIYYSTDNDEYSCKIIYNNRKSVNFW